MKGSSKTYWSRKKWLSWTQAVTNGTRMIDTANKGHVIAIIPRLVGASGFTRVTLNPEQNKVISAGLQTARMVTNGIANSRFEPIR